jgi:hypothetical protein
MQEDEEEEALPEPEVLEPLPELEELLEPVLDSLAELDPPPELEPEPELEALPKLEPLPELEPMHVTDSLFVAGVHEPVAQ